MSDCLTLPPPDVEQPATITGLRIDRFSTIDDLPRPARPDVVLAILRKTPRVSGFEMSDRPDLARAIRHLKAAGKIKDGPDLGYPWIGYEVIET